MLFRAVFHVLFRLQQTYEHQFAFGLCVEAYLCKHKGLAQLLCLFYM